MGDWEKLSSARERHALDVQKEKLEEAAQKEQRKQERAAKRAARKVAAEVPRGPEEAVSRSTLTSPSATTSRSLPLPLFTSPSHINNTGCLPVSINKCPANHCKHGHRCNNLSCLAYAWNFN